MVQCTINGKQSRVIHSSQKNIILLIDAHEYVKMHTLHVNLLFNYNNYTVSYKCGIT